MPRGANLSYIHICMANSEENLCAVDPDNPSKFCKQCIQFLCQKNIQIQMCCLFSVFIFRFATKKKQQHSTASIDQHELESNGQNHKSVVVKLKRKCCIKTSLVILACLLFLIAVALIFYYGNAILIFVHVRSI